MEITTDLYLRDCIVQGQLWLGEERALDVANRLREDCLVLADASVQRLHPPLEPRSLGSVRIQKDRILLIAPHDRPATVLARIRGWWVEKRRVTVELGLETFSVAGTMHFLLRESVSIEDLGRGQDARTFVPVTDATVTSFYRADWSLIWPTVFVRRAAIGYLALPDAVNGEPPEDTVHELEPIESLPGRRPSEPPDPPPGA